MRSPHASLPLSIFVSLAAFSACSDASGQATDLPKERIDEIMEELTTESDQGNQNSSPTGMAPPSFKIAPIKHEIQFIRLKHSGIGWNDGMTPKGADEQFLEAFRNRTGLRTTRHGKSLTFGELDALPEPAPFVYLTGNGKMGRISRSDIKSLRQYCLNGGLLIADAGSASFHQSFLHTMRMTFPDKKLVDIADDDPIYRIPYSFPDGPPAFWHHGGRRPLGIKHGDRWICFYHPGDMNDAWKNNSQVEVTPQLREAAVSLGINLIYYAMTHSPNATHLRDATGNDSDE